MIHDDIKYLQQLHRETMEAMQKNIRAEREVFFLTVRTWKTIIVAVTLFACAVVLAWGLHWSGVHWHKE